MINSELPLIYSYSQATPMNAIKLIHHKQHHH
jgi:hypothetical protein